MSNTVFRSVQRILGVKWVPALVSVLFLTWSLYTEAYYLILQSGGPPMVRNFHIITDYYQAPFVLETQPIQILMAVLAVVVSVPINGRSLVQRTFEGISPIKAAIIGLSWGGAFLILFSWGIFLANKSNLESGLILRIANLTGGDGGVKFAFFFLAPVLISFLAEAIWLGVLKGIQMSSILMFPLPLLVWEFDHGEFYTHFTYGAVAIGMGWVTNEVLLFGAISAFGISTAIKMAKTRKGNLGPKI